MKPEVVCLCGSTRFYDTFQKVNFDLTMEGKIVLSVGFYPHAQDQAHGGAVGVTEEQKRHLDELHCRKIDLADRVHVINVDGYIGSSCMSEIAYALLRGKAITFFDTMDGEELLRNSGYQLSLLIEKHCANERNAAVSGLKSQHGRSL